MEEEEGKGKGKAKKTKKKAQDNDCKYSIGYVRYQSYQKREGGYQKDIVSMYQAKKTAGGYHFLS